MGAHSRGPSSRTNGGNLPDIATVLWIATIQLVAVEEFASSQWAGYSRLTQYVSELGGAASPTHTLVNASIALAAVCLIGGTLNWLRLRVLDPVKGAGLCATGYGMLVLAWFHLDSSPLIHGLAANLAFAFGPITTLYIAAHSLKDRARTILNYLTVAFALAASAAWVVHATNIEPVRGLTQRVMELFYLAALVSLAFVLRHRARSADSN